MDIVLEAPVPQKINNSAKTRGRPAGVSASGLPGGMVARSRQGKTFYAMTAMERRGRKRTEIQLGCNLVNALHQFKAISSETKLLRPYRADIKPWVARELFKTCRSHAGRRKIQFDLTLADVEKLVLESGNRCALTGIPFNAEKPEGARFRYWMPSIDRIDCKRHYEVNNVRLVAMAVNIVLSDIGEDVLINIARALLKKRRLSA